MEITVFDIDIHDALQGTKIASLSPRLKIVNNGFAINSYVEDAESFVVILL